MCVCVCRFPVEFLRGRAAGRNIDVPTALGGREHECRCGRRSRCGPVCVCVTGVYRFAATVAMGIEGDDLRVPMASVARVIASRLKGLSVSKDVRTAMVVASSVFIHYLTAA